MSEEIEQACREIACFMDQSIVGEYPYINIVNLEGEKVLGVEGHYGVSLDALVPVWEKLSNRKGLAVYEFLKGKPDNLVEYMFRKEKLTLQQAACLLTAKAIREVKGCLNVK